MMAKDGEVAHTFQPLLQVSRLFFWRLMQAQWPIPWSRSISTTRRLWTPAVHDQTGRMGVTGW